MANKHQLSLELPESNNIKVLRLFDTSIYNPDLKVDCGYINITSPGYSLPRSIEVLPNFNLVLNACTLGLQRQGCGERSEPLPDGIYRIRYHVSPNDKVYVEYYHLRQTQTINRWYNMLAELEMAACEPDEDVKEQLKEMQLIKGFLDAAKAKVEYVHDPEAGMELFMYAKKKLDKFIQGNICTNC